MTADKGHVYDTVDELLLCKLCAYIYIYSALLYLLRYD